MNHRVSRYFDIRELVCPHVYDKFGLYAWQFFDPRLLDVLLAIREGIGKPIIITIGAMEETSPSEDFVVIAV